MAPILLFRTAVLFVAISALATATTVLLGLDTTAVLLTPVVLSVSVQLDLPPLPFALLTVWLANTASRLLPVSNLTNRLALDRLDLESHAFAARMWAPAVVAVVLTVVLIGMRYRRLLRVRYAVPHRPRIDDPVLLGAGGAGLPRHRAGFCCRRLSGSAWCRGRWRRPCSTSRSAWRPCCGTAATRRLGVIGEDSRLDDLLEVAGVGAVASNLLTTCSPTSCSSRTRPGTTGCSPSCSTPTSGPWCC